MIPGQVSPAEAELLERIRMSLSGWRFKIPLETHRYYLAHSPKGTAAVLRLKNGPDLEEWRTRHWSERRLFADSAPTISDVTLEVLQALASSLSLSPSDFAKSRTWVVVDDGCRFVFTTADGPPCDGAIPLWSTGEGIAAALCPGVSVPRDVPAPGGRPFVNQYGAVRFTPLRAFRWRGAPPVPHMPIAGGPIDGVSGLDGMSGGCAARGTTLKIETGGAFIEDAILECDADGRAVARVGGLGVLRALERSAGPGAVVWAALV